VGLAHLETPSKPLSMRPAQMASLPTPLLTRREHDAAVSLSKSADARYSFIDFFLPPVHFGHDPSDGTAMTSDNDRLTTLHVIEQLRQMGFGFGSLNFTHVCIFD
jgi:hypothetical protein